MFTSEAFNIVTMQPLQKVTYEGADRRSHHRKRILKGAIVRFHKGYGIEECVLRDITADGARISMGTTSILPTNVQLHITGERTQLEASIQWRTSRDFGVKFILNNT